MFTGLIQRIGTVRRVSRGAGLVLEIEADVPWPRPLVSGESVAVNGACLTVVNCLGSRFTADVLRETESRTGLSEAWPGAKVNLERALRAGEPMGGHLVQGHVDGRGKILEKIPRGRDFRFRISCGRVLAAETVVKGSIAIDGVSLTVTEVGADFIAVDVIPTTLRETTLSLRKVGDSVNIESDVAGKYFSKWAAERAENSDSPSEHAGLTEEALIQAGFCSVDAQK